MKRPEDIDQPDLRACVGGALRAMREHEGLTQQEVGWRMRRSEKTIALIEKGRASFEMMERYLEAVGKTVPDLIVVPATVTERLTTAARESALRPRSSVDRVPTPHPPDLHLVKDAPPSPAASRALSSSRTAKGLGPRSVASQPIPLARVTPKVTPSRSRARDPSPARPRRG